MRELANMNIAATVLRCEGGGGGGGEEGRMSVGTVKGGRSGCGGSEGEKKWVWTL